MEAHLNQDLKNFISRSEDGVFLIGHSSALCRIGGQLVIMDPLWDFAPYGDRWLFIPKQINCDEILPDVKACTVSHIHQDHVCPPILKKLTCSIHVMNGRKALEDLLWGIGHPQTYPSLIWHSIGHGLEAYFVPHPFNTIDSSVFVRSKSTGYCVYHGNDNFLNDQILDRVARDVPRVDVALLPYGFVHWYPHLMGNMTQAEKDGEYNRLKKQSLAQGAAFVKALEPNFYVPFGNSIYYNAGPNHPLNLGVTSPYEWEGATVMYPGDFLMADGYESTKFRGAEAHQELIDGHLEERANPPLDIDIKLTELDFRSLNERLAQAKFNVPGHQLVINGVIIDLGNFGVSWHSELKEPYTWFDFDKKIFWEWLHGSMTFEQAIGTREFVCYRVPNRYSVEVFEFMNNFL